MKLISDTGGEKVEELLSLQNVVKSYGKKIVVDEVSFNVRRGEVLGLLGPNGAGKTTIIRMIMGINAPDSGNIHFYINQEE